MNNPPSPLIIFISPSLNIPIAQIASRFGIGLSSEHFMMRCAVCNGYGYRRVDKEEATRRGDCPAGVLAQIDEFFACRSCDKLYWEGPKSQGAYGTFAQIFDGFAVDAARQ